MARRTRTVTSRSAFPSGDSVTTEGTTGGFDDPTVGDNVEQFASDGGSDFVNPASLGNDSGSGGSSDGSAAGEPKRKRRGRPRGSSNTKATESISVDGLSGILFSAHAMLAGITGVQELTLEKSETDQMAEATANMMRHYPNAVISPKTVDTINFAMVMGMVYGTRMMAIRARKKMERASETATPVDATVVRRDPIQPSPNSGKVPGDFFPSNPGPGDIFN